MNDTVMTQNGSKHVTFDVTINESYYDSKITRDLINEFLGLYGEDYDLTYNDTSYEDLMEDSNAFATIAARMEAFAKVSRIVTPLVIGLFLLIGLIGNTLVIYVTMTTQRVIKHPVHSMLVLNLAVADIIYLLASAPYQATAHSVPKWIYGSFLCPAFHYVTIQTMAVSIFTMCSLAVMRFMALMMPFKIQRSFITTSGKFTGYLVIAFVWIIASFLAVPNAIYYHATDTMSSTTHAVISHCFWVNDVAMKTYAFAILIVTYILPFMLVATLYFLIGREILCYMKTNKPPGSTDIRTKKEQSEYMKTTIMVFCLIIAFLVCWFPYHLFMMISVSKNFRDRPYALTRIVISMVGHCMSYAHACVNPIIYTFAAPGFRRSFRMSFKKRRIGSDVILGRSCIARRRCKRSNDYSFVARSSRDSLQMVPLHNPPPIIENETSSIKHTHTSFLPVSNSGQ